MWRTLIIWKIKLAHSIFDIDDINGHISRMYLAAIRSDYITNCVEHILDRSSSYAVTIDLPLVNSNKIDDFIPEFIRTMIIDDHSADCKYEFVELEFTLYACRFYHGCNNYSIYIKA